MDYLYINAIVKETYTDLPCACPFPEAYREDIRGLHVINDDCMKNPAVSNVLSYYSVKSRDKAPLLVLSNVERHTKSVSVGRFAQHLGWEWNSELLRNGLDTILESAFYSEDEIAEIANANDQAQLPRNKTAANQVHVPVLSEQVKSAILTAVMLRWLRNEPALRIAVPTGSNYNQYVLGAIKAIYQFFPVGLRAEMGFCSYLPNLQDTMTRVYIGFIPEEMADPATVFLDGSSQAALNKLSKGTTRDALDRLIQYLSRCDTETLSAFLEDIYQEIEGAGDGSVISSLSAKHYLPTGEAIRILMESGDTAEQLKSWLKFYEEIDKYSPSMQKNIKAHIAKQADGEALCALFKKECESVHSAKEILDKLRSYQFFVEAGEALGDQLWNIAINALLSHNITYSKIDQEIFRIREKLSAIATVGRLDVLLRLAVEETLRQMAAQPLTSSNQATQLQRQAEQLKQDIAAQQMPSMDELLAAVSMFQEKLIEKHGTMVIDQLRQRLEDLQNMPTVRYSDMETAIRTATALLEETKLLPASEQATELQQKTWNYLEQKKQEANSSQTKVFRLIEMIDSSRSYFAAVEALATEDMSKIDDDEKRNIADHLRQKRPTSFGAYEQEYFSFYRNKLALQSLAGAKPFVCHTIIQDLCILDFSLNFTADSKLDTFRKEFDHVQYLAKRIKPNGSAFVELNGMVYDQTQFACLLDSKKFDKLALKPEKMENAFVYLAECSIYREQKNILLPILEVMYHNSCDLTVLAKGIFTGAFAASKKDYEAAFTSIMLRAKSGPREAMEQLRTLKDSLRCTKASAEAFKNAYASVRSQLRAKEKENEDSGKRKKKKNAMPVWLIIVICVTGAALLVAAVLSLFVLLGNSEETPKETTPTATTAPKEDTPKDPTKATDPTTAPANPIEAQLRSGSFEDHANKVRAFLKDGNNEALAAHYRAGTSSVFEVSKRAITWNEYVFWELWTIATNDPQEITEKTFDDALGADVILCIHLIYPKGNVTKNNASAETEKTLTDAEITGILDSAKASFAAFMNP